MIDRSYISKLVTSPQATAVVASCIELDHALGASVGVEGIETAHHSRTSPSLAVTLDEVNLLPDPFEGKISPIGWASNDHKAIGHNADGIATMNVAVSARDTPADELIRTNFSLESGKSEEIDTVDYPGN